MPNDERAARGAGTERDERAESEESAGGDPAGRAAESPAAEEPVDYRDRWLRAEADLQNFRRRAARDLEEAVRFAEERLLLETIGEMDDLERALTVAREAGAPDPWVQGIQMVAHRMTQNLERRGVTRMQPLGAAFDPEQHEALLELETDEVPAGHVVQVVRPGYQRQGRALRAARVVVARAREGNAG